MRLMQLAEERNVDVEMVSGTRIEQLAKKGKKTQGCVLKCFEKPTPFIDCLPPLVVDKSEKEFEDNELKLSLVEHDQNLRNQVLTEWLNMDDENAVEEEEENHKNEGERKGGDLVLALEQIQDPQNLGAICRWVLHVVS